MSEAIQIHDFGGPEVMQLETVGTGEPGAGEIKLAQTHIGINYIDVYFREGVYRPAQMPFTPGVEAAGEITALGAGVTGLHVGQRVAYAARPPGAYSAERIIAADSVVALPENIANEQAAAMMLKGMTAHMLLTRVYAVKPGDTILIHAAAGGVGLLVCQWAQQLGATVIGTVGSQAKADLAQAHGCHYPIRYRDESLLERVREITQGQGVAVAYDSVGADTLKDSLACLQRRGVLVSFGQSSGKPPIIEVGELAAGGSLYLTRPTLFDYISEPAEMRSAAEALFTAVSSGALSIEIGERWPLAQAADAHRALEARQTTGSLLLSV